MKLIKKENDDKISLAEYYQQCYERTKNKEYIKKAEQILEEYIKETYDFEYSASFYETIYKQTNDEKYFDKAEQAWRWCGDEALVEFYERQYKKTNDKEYLDKAEQAYKENNNKTSLVRFYKRFERWDECLTILIEDILINKNKTSLVQLYSQY